jgi:hypothetical protein
VCRVRNSNSCPKPPLQPRSSKQRNNSWIRTNPLAKEKVEKCAHAGVEPFFLDRNAVNCGAQRIASMGYIARI